MEIIDKYKSKKLLLALIVIACFFVAYVFISSSSKAVDKRGSVFATLSLEESFQEIPSEIYVTLSKSGAIKELLESGCKKYVGKQIPANANRENIIWMVSTPGCGWGAHAGPIWVIEQSNNGGRLIFEGGGIGFELLESIRHGYRDIVVSNSSAGYYGDDRFEYNGTSYVKVASRYAHFSDPDACKILPDILKCN